MTRAPEDVQATFCATLVDQWVRMGLRTVVVAPGSRSTPMALALAARPDLSIQIAHDERSAAFIALGIGLATRVPAALLCTSGTAATHFHAAVVEADLSGVPLLALTADRPPELQGIGAPQTINQVELYGAVVRCYANPGVAELHAASTWRDSAAEWWLLATGRNPGPVHVNLPFREPLVGLVGDLPTPLSTPPSTRQPTRQPPHDVAPDGGKAPPELAALAAILEGRHGVIVAGAGVDDPAAVELLAHALQWPILADPRSGCRHLSHAVSAFDSILRTPFAEAHRPAAVLHLGEPPASKVFGQWLLAGDALHVHVHAQQRTIDPLRLVTQRIVNDPSTVCRELAALVNARGDATWLADWQRAGQLARSAIDAAIDAGPLSEPSVARILSDCDAQLVVSSSMPVRDVEWFGRPTSTTKVYSNRGANGIDGVIATAIGVAVGSGKRTVALLGDVAFCHDQSSLTALAARNLPLTIVVVDNDGGGIFSFLPQASTLPPAQFEQLFGTPHGTDIVAVARAHGLGARTATTADDLRAALADAAVAVVCVPSDRAHNVEVHAQVNAAVAAAIA